MVVGEGIKCQKLIAGVAGSVVREVREGIMTISINLGYIGMNLTKVPSFTKTFSQLEI